MSNELKDNLEHKCRS